MPMMVSPIIGSPHHFEGKINVPERKGQWAGIKTMLTREASGVPGHGPM